MNSEPTMPKPIRQQVLSFRAKRGICFLFFLCLTLGVTGNAQNERPKILGISHVSIRVSDYCKAQAFFAQLQGGKPNCPPADTKTVPEGGGSAIWLWSQWITLNVNSVYAYGSKPAPECLVEIVGFYTADAKSLRQYLASHDVKVTELLTGGRANFDAFDPENHR